MANSAELLDRALRCGCGICEACEFAKRWDDMSAFFKEHADSALMVHDWPECGPGSIRVEAMYQAFKARLLDEMRIVSREGA